MYTSDRQPNAPDAQDTTAENEGDIKTYSALYVLQLRAFINAADDVDVDSDTIEDLLEGLEDLDLGEEEVQESDLDEDVDSNNLAFPVHEQHTPIEESGDLDDLDMETAVIGKLKREGGYAHLMPKLETALLEASRQ